MFIEDLKLGENAVPTYHYISPNNYLLKDIDADKLSGMTIYIEQPDDPGNGRLIWTVEHKMFEEPDIKCPISGEKAHKTMIGMDYTFIMRGEGLVRDKIGAKRDMDLYTLQNNDPYAHMREPGEKDDLIDRLKKGGKHNPNRRHYTV